MSQVIPSCWLLQGGNEDYKSPKLRIKTVSSGALIEWNTCQVKNKTKLVLQYNKEMMRLSVFLSSSCYPAQLASGLKTPRPWKAQWLKRSLKVAQKVSGNEIKPKYGPWFLQLKCPGSRFQCKVAAAEKCVYSCVSIELKANLVSKRRSQSGVFASTGLKQTN